MENEHAGAPRMTGIAQGRADLAAWTDGQPDDLYADDTDFQALVAYHGLEGRASALSEVGRVVAGPLDAVVRENNLARNLPVLEGWDGIGRRTERIAHHPTWREAGRHIYGAGVLSAYAEQPVPLRYALALFYLTAQAGEAGHNCPVACGAGAIRALQALGTDDQRSRYLPRLLDPEFDTCFTAAQFLTEVQGGSDVGANVTRAEPVGTERGPGSQWRITGEKWFCSNADADVFLLTARLADTDRPGTAGLGLFLVPRRLPSGEANAFHLRRLKDKLGTRSMASGEMDFQGALAEAIGPVEDGFKNTMRLVINTSRLYNAAGCAAHARRAWVVASTYAMHRRAFGQPIGRFAEVREALAEIRADAVASIAATLWLASLQERIDRGEATAEEQAFFRVALNLNKMRTAVVAHTAVNRGIEVLGGNGAIESFSVLPRLLRDNVVYENWEGTHNVLRAQVRRDCRRLGVHHGFFNVLAQALPESEQAELDADRRALAEVLGLPEDLQALRFRRLADRLATWVMLAAMTPMAELAPARALTRRHLAPLRLDPAYLDAVDALQRR